MLGGELVVLLVVVVAVVVVAVVVFVLPEATAPANGPNSTKDVAVPAANAQAAARRFLFNRRAP